VDISQYNFISRLKAIEEALGIEREEPVQESTGRVGPRRSRQ